MTSPELPPVSQFRLLRERRFAPFFWTQFFGAFNDNLYKNALLLMMTYGAAGSLSAREASLMNNLAAALFILPYLLFSALAGQLADTWEKTRLIRAIKLAEIGIMVGAVIGFLLESLPLLMTMLFCLGTHSAFFGPVKYSIIPQHLRAQELVGGNALVESGTFIAILTGTLLAGVLSKSSEPVLWTGLIIVTVALMGWGCSRHIPIAEPSQPDLRLSFRPWRDTLATVRIARMHRTVFVSMMGISWFWFVGASYLTQLPSYTRHVLGGDQTVVTLLLTLFSIGIAAGSLLCEKLSGHSVERALVPLGAIGMTLFGIDVFMHHPAPINTSVAALRTVSDLAGTWEGYRIMFDYIALGMSGGLYIVPLYTLVQQLSAPEYRSRTIAAINIFNALFMVASAVLAILCLGPLGWDIPQFLLAIGVVNALVGLWLCRAEPDFWERFRQRFLRRA